MAFADPVTSPSPPLATLARAPSFPLVETQKEVTGGDAFWQVAAAFLSRSTGTPSGGATRRSASSPERGSGSDLVHFQANGNRSLRVPYSAGNVCQGQIE